MKRHNFRTLGSTEVRKGLAIWLDGRHFEDTNPIGPRPNDDVSSVCGPFLVERVLFQSKESAWKMPEPRVDLIDPSTGSRRSMMCSWLLVPKEER